MHCLPADSRARVAAETPRPHSKLSTPIWVIPKTISHTQKQAGRARVCQQCARVYVYTLRVLTLTRVPPARV